MVDDPIFNCQIDVSFGPFIHVFSVVCLVERAMMFPLSTWMSFVLVSASNKQTVSFCIALVDYLWCKFTCHKIFIEYFMCQIAFVSAFAEFLVNIESLILKLN